MTCNPQSAADSPFHPSTGNRDRRAPLAISRRDWLRLWAAGALAGPACGWLPALADQLAKHPDRKRACILLWMTGGPSQIDTFDPKPGHKNGGPVRAIETSIPSIRISEYLPRVAREMKELVLVRSMSTKEQDHGRATYLVRTGHAPIGPIRYPSLGSLFSKELASADCDLPGYVSVGPQRFQSPDAFGPGFLGPRHAPLIVGDGGVFGTRGEGAGRLSVEDIERPNWVTAEQFDARLGILGWLEEGFRASRPGLAAESHREAYTQAVRMMQSQARQAFDLESEPSELRDAYGRNPFGQGCLLARRLVERGVPFVEVSLNNAPGAPGAGWDTHQNNFEATGKLCAVLDPAWATLIEDLRGRGLLDMTLLVWMGEFGRTPVINRAGGRDHHSAAWSVVLGGGGVKGGSVVGRSSPDGMTIEDRPVAIPDLMATVSLALGVDPMKQNPSNVGRPIRIADPDAKPIREIL